MPELTNDSSPIEQCLDQWHRFLRSGDADLLDDLLTEDVTFISPIVFTPQEGKELTKLYLMAAGTTLGGADGPDDTTTVSAPAADAGSADESWNGKFRYVRRVREGRDAVLEFETMLDDKYVNGVDLITCDDSGRITNFKVMIRPLQAVNAVHEQMRAMLERMSSSG